MREGIVEAIEWSVSKFGDDMVKITVDDEMMSTFDAGIISVAKHVEEGSEILYDFKMSGKYKNISHLNGVDAEKKSKSGAGTVSPKKAYTAPAGNRDFVKEGRDKTISILSEACLQGYLANKGEMPSGEWMHAMGSRLGVYVMKIVDGTFFKKDSSEPPF
jgi:hypothetical protein